MSEQPHDLAAAFALDALDELDEARFLRHLEGCEQCQAEVADVRETAAMLGDVEEPPATLRDTILGQVAQMSQVETRSSRRPIWMGLAAAAMVVILALLGTSLLQGDDLIGAVLGDPEAVTFEVSATDVGVGSFEQMVVVYSEAEQAAVMVAEGMTQVDDDRTYEMWLIDESGPIAAGTFTPDAGGEATVLIDGDPSPGHVFAITEEPAGGVSAPTGDPLATTTLDI
jgi:anti-sigma-K factor RskA